MSAEQELSELRALIVKSDLVEVDSVQSGSDDCGKPILTKSGKILRHRGYMSEVRQYTEALRKMANMARKIAVLEDILSKIKTEFEGYVDGAPDATGVSGLANRISAICENKP